MRSTLCGYHLGSPDLRLGSPVQRTEVSGAGEAVDGSSCGQWGERLIYRGLQQLGGILRQQIGCGIT